MYDIEICKKEYTENRVKYFKKYFRDKCINDGIYDAFKNNLKYLSSAYIGFLFLYDCLKIISESEDFNSYNKETRLYIKTTINSLKSSFKDLETIVFKLSEELNKEKI